MTIIFPIILILLYFSKENEFRFNKALLIISIYCFTVLITLFIVKTIKLQKYISLCSKNAISKFVCIICFVLFYELINQMGFYYVAIYIGFFSGISNFF